MEDESALRVIERLTGEVCCFGQQTGVHECKFLDGQRGLEEFVQQEQKAKDDVSVSV